jgi:biotin carboxyl carrier protein
MTGRIVRIDVETGDEVSEGDVLLVIEAMKMENEITAPVSGTVKEIDVSAGARVSEGDTLLVIEPAGD